MSGLGHVDIHIVRLQTFRQHVQLPPMKKTAAPLSKYDLVHIYWHDAAMHGTDQVTIDEVKKGYGIMRGHVAGWLIHETKEDVTLAMDFFPAQTNDAKDTFRTLQSYPKSGIEKIVTLKTLEIHPKRV
jgi:hypothetical protein